MRPLLPTAEDLTRLAIGAAGVAAAGLLLGAATRPDLDDHAFTGPQILMPHGGQRNAADVTDPGIAAYGGRTPEYVIGTDWTRPKPPQPESAPLNDGDDIEVTVLAADGVDEPAPTRSVWRDDPPERAAYPSETGGAGYPDLWGPGV